METLIKYLLYSHQIYYWHFSIIIQKLPFLTRKKLYPCNFHNESQDNDIQTEKLKPYIPICINMYLLMYNYSRYGVIYFLFCSVSTFPRCVSKQLLNSPDHIQPTHQPTSSPSFVPSVSLTSGLYIQRRRGSVLYEMATPWSSIKSSVPSISFPRNTFITRDHTSQKWKFWIHNSVYTACTDL